jgi:hypothetical protein
MDKDIKTSKPSSYVNALPYLSVVPITEQCLDFSIIDKIEEGLSDKILQQLLSDSPVISANIPLGKEMGMLVSNIEQRKALQKTFEEFKQQKSGLSLGYPIVLMDDSKLGQPIASPLFLWKVELSVLPDSNKVWTLKPLDGNKAYLNPILKNYLEARFELDWEKEIGLIDTIDKKVIAETCKKLSEKLKLAHPIKTTIQACPPPPDIPKNIIINSIILGSFGPITIKDAKKLPKNLKARERKQWQTKIAALPSNSAQDELIGTIFNGHHVAAEGISNTGKTHVIASILPSLLADKGSALIVSSQPSSFNDIQHHLEQLGIKNIGILSLQDESLDKERLINYLESLPKRTRIASNFDNATYSKQLDKHMQLRRHIEKAYDTLHASIVYGWNWTELVGHCLHHHKKSDKQILCRFLDNKHFEFTAKEHYMICRELGEHYVHYHKIDALKHGLNALHSRFFNEESSIGATRSEAKTGINLYRHKTNSLYQSFLVFVGNYAEHLKFEYRDFAADLEQQIDKIERDLDLYNNLYGEAFDKQSGFQNAKLKLLSMFSRKHQEIRAVKKQLLEDYSNLKASYKKTAYFEANFPDIAEESKLAAIVSKLEDFRTDLQSWTATIPTLVATQIETLSEKTDFPTIFKEQHKDLEKFLIKLIKQLNEAKILRKEVKPIEGKIQVKEAFLLNLLLQFQKLENEWRDIDDYYHWRRSWLYISNKTQKVIQAFVNTGTYDWLSGFQSWFFHQILTQEYSIALPSNTNEESLPFELYIQTLDDVQKRISEKADLITKERQSDQIKRIKKEKDLTLTNARPIFRNKKIKDLLHWIGLEHLGDFFPIILATPAMAEQLSGLKTATFDAIIIDNAHEIPSKTGIDLLKLGNQRIVLGQPLEEYYDSKEDEKEETLLQWMLLQKGRRYQFLENIHSKNAADIDRLNKTEIIDPNAFQLAIADYLKEFVAEKRLVFNKSVEGVVVDLVIEPLYKGQSPIAIICDGGMLSQAKYDFQLAVDKARILKNEAYILQYAWSVNWWKNTARALQPILAFIIEWDKEHKI